MNRLMLEPFWSDYVVYAALLMLIIYSYRVSRDTHLYLIWRSILLRPIAAVAAIILIFFVLIASLDSIHLKQQQTAELYQQHSVLDQITYPMSMSNEKTYSAPMAHHLYSPVSKLTANGVILQVRPLLSINADLSESELSRLIINSCLSNLLKMGLIGVVLSILLTNLKCPNATRFSVLITVLALYYMSSLALDLSQHFHVMGTDKVGRDVLYQAIKSIRTGLLIGTLTTMVMLPFALVLGLLAGYFSGIVDDVIQYFYTTISSVPGVLLIAASMLSIEVAISHHAELFSSSLVRADVQLIVLCCILGIASWTSLCRLLRAETFKLRQMDYIKASRAQGASHSWILRRHILPNVMHVVLITLALDFSGLVLAEAVLSYIGIGVHPMTHSWGNMINMARLELAREPIVWWPLVSSFLFMFFLVLAANLFADAMRDGFDPRNH